MVRIELYQAIKLKLEQDVPEVKHIDLWNHNVEFLEQEDAWARPAVFVEFGTIGWEPFAGGKHQRGKGVVRIHLVTDWNEGEHDQAFAIGQKISEALEGLEGELFNGMVLIETATNHNHEDLLESIDSYAVRYLR